MLALCLVCGTDDPWMVVPFRVYVTGFQLPGSTPPAFYLADHEPVI